jgi:hypothetical protein
MPRTTLALDEDLLLELKKRAAKEKTSLTRLTNRLLRSALRQKGGEGSSKAVWKTYRCGRPKVDICDRGPRTTSWRGRAIPD